jgi:HAD superfamily hydrolase (TIGR01509 family)
MHNGGVSTILFDWDGTLCDSGAAVMRAFEKSLAEFGVSFTLAQYRAVYTPAWTVMYEAFGLPRSRWPEAEQRWLFHFQEAEPLLLPGAAGVLTALSDAGLRLGLVTGASRGRLGREMLRLGVETAFAVVVGHDDVVRKKPDPEGIFTALDRLGASASDCCYVGDAPDDIRMGRSAGVRTIGVRSEYVDPARLENCGADHLLHSIADLPAVLRE